MRELSQLVSYLQSKSAGEVEWKATLKKECLSFEFTVQGMLQRFFEGVVASEFKLIAPEWAVVSKQKGDDLHISLQLNAAQTRDLLWETNTLASVEENLGTDAATLLRALPPKTLNTLVKKWSAA